jgi:hypothetical protein
MTRSSHLWAVGYDDMERANQVRNTIINIGWERPYVLAADGIALRLRCRLDAGR